MSPPHPLLLLAGVAAAYAGTAWLGLLLAIPPGYATAVWPPSGIALIACLFLGPRAVPAVWLGSFAVNVGLSLDLPGGAGAGIPAATTIGIGAAAQAWLGSHLIRRFVGFPTPLVTDRSILRFLLLGGPVACLVSASVGVATLAALGRIVAGQVGMTWWTWWVGDTIGVLVVAPLLLVFAGEPREVWRERRASVAAPMALGFVVSVMVFVVVSHIEHRRLRLEFEQRASAFAQPLGARLDGALDAVQSIVSLYASSERVERDEFRYFVQQTLARWPEVQALEWVPAVSAADRERFEAAMRAQGFPEFVIRERDAAGHLVPAGRRPEYYPVTYLEPHESNGQALGFDLGSDLTRRVALMRARAKGIPVVTERLALVQDGDQSRFGFLLMAPVHRRVAGSHETFQGLAVGAYRLEDVLASALPGDPTRFAFVLRDGGTVLHTHETPAGRELGPTLHWSASFPVADRRWTLDVSPTAEYVAGLATWQSTLVLAIGLAFTSLLGAFLLMVTGRTVALRRTNAELESQIEVRTLAEHALGESDARMRTLFENTVDGIVTIDEIGTVESFNPAAQEMFGYAPEEVIGRNVSMLMPSPYRDEHDVYLHNYMMTGNAKIIGIGREVTARRTDGSEFPIDLTISEVPLGTGRRLFAGIIRDITDRRRSEDELLATANELRRSNADLEQFAYAASHDLQEPLRMVSSYVQLLERRYRGQLDGEADRYIGYAVDGARRMQKLIRGLLSYSRVRSDAHEPVGFDLEDSLRQAIANLEAAIAESGAKITWDPMPRVSGGPAQTTHVLQNLLENAIRYSHEDVAPVVHLSVKGWGDRWEIAVHDNGIGFPPDQAERIFGIFQRGHAGRYGDGTGIGLALAKRIVEAQGGEIWARSTPDSGSVFTFTLPTAPGDEHDKEEAG